MSWPLPVSRRIDALADLVEELSGERPNRNDLVGALVLSASTSAPDLLAQLSDYQSASARDIARGGLALTGLLSLAKDKPGRRRRGPA